MLIFFLSLLFFLSDFFLKKILTLRLDPNISYSLIGDLVSLRLVHNTGAAFGILKGKVFFLILVGAIFLFVFIFWVLREKHTLSNKIILSMIFGGAACNLYDRIFLGYVVDYIDLGWWPVFNLSDSFISVGCILLAIPIIFTNARAKNTGSPRE